MGPRPMLATSAAMLPIGPDWTYEVKWDGYRTVAVKNGSAVRLLSRNSIPGATGIERRVKP